jgi:hypothetical protein
MIHLWRVIGHLLGITEQYNACTSPDLNHRLTTELITLTPFFIQTPHPSCLTLATSYQHGVSLTMGCRIATAVNFDTTRTWYDSSWANAFLVPSVTAKWIIRTVAHILSWESRNHCDHCGHCDRFGDSHDNKYDIDQNKDTKLDFEIGSYHKHSILQSIPNRPIQSKTYWIFIFLASSFRTIANHALHSRIRHFSRDIGSWWRSRLIFYPAIIRDTLIHILDIGVNVWVILFGYLWLVLGRRKV